VGLFRPYERPEEAADQASTETGAAQQPAQPVKKDAPTPSRKDAEAARRERLHPSLTPAQQRKADRQAQQASRQQQFVAADSEPGRVLMRDYIDSRKGFAQWSMPALMISLAISLALVYVNTTLATVAAFLPYVVIGGIIVDLFIMWSGYKKLHAKRLPKAPLKGQLAYGINRSINFRRFRVPAARVKPGDEI
jgi:Flp pilus assembly protein TadB